MVIYNICILYNIKYMVCILYKYDIYRIYIIHFIYNRI